MLATTDHWPSSIMVNETKTEIHLIANNNNNSQYSPYIEPIWASLSLIISKLKYFVVFKKK
jgi:hypothetical protein